MSRPSGNPQAGAVDVVVIGAGHSGLAMSRFLTARSIEHVVLERGEIANSWVHERWDALRLLTPNWQSRLPGYAYAGADPDAYMSMPEVVRFIRGYADFCRAPVHTGAEVTSLTPCGDRYRLLTNHGEWRARAVVIASGAFNIASVPTISKCLPDDVVQLTPHDYRNAGQLRDGGVLVVGASATGLQLAAEIQGSGRQVTLAAGEHVRMPRVYRGRDIQYWMDAVGLLDEKYDQIDDIGRARRVPSPQLTGSRERALLDLNALAEQGVRVTGRLAGVRGHRALFSGAIRNVCKLADLKMNRLLDTIDQWIAGSGHAAEPARRFAPTTAGEPPCLDMDLSAAGVRTVVWATGFRPDYSWLRVPVLDHKGRILHEGGVVHAPGLYVMGLPYLRRRKSSFIHGAEDDARELSSHLAAYLEQCARRMPVRMAG